MRSDDTPMSCPEAEAYLSLSVENELDHLRSAHLDEHLTGCESCRTLEAELTAERLWILENSVQAPALSASFASKVCGEIRRESLHRSPFTKWLRKAGQWSGIAAAGVLLALVTFGFFDDGASPEPGTDLAAGNAAGSAASERGSERGFGRGTDSTLNAPGATLVSFTTADGPNTSTGGLEAAHQLPSCSPDSPEGYAICSPAEAPASTLPASTALSSSEKDLGAELVAIASEVSPAPEPINTLSASFNRLAAGRLDVGQLFGLFARRYENMKMPLAKPVNREDPCLDDLNDDGKVDGGDVAYGCLLLLEAKPVAPYSDSEDESGETPDCDNREPCV